MSDDDPQTDGPALRSRPATEDSFGIPESEAGILPWDFVAELLRDDRNNWLATVRPDVVFAWRDYPSDATRWEFAE